MNKEERSRNKERRKKTGISSGRKTEASFISLASTCSQTAPICKCEAQVGSPEIWTQPPTLPLSPHHPLPSRRKSLTRGLFHPFLAVLFPKLKKKEGEKLGASDENIKSYSCNVT
jgi:hypothetical protein